MQFGRWTVISDGGINKWGHQFYKCRCECGLEKLVRTYHLESGKSKQCKSCSKTKHKLSNHPLFNTWVKMRMRGIKVCERWDNFENFLEDMGERPKGHKFKRINKDGDYEPSNCHWYK